MGLLAIALLCLVGLFILKRIFNLLTSSDRPSEVHDVAEDVALASRVAVGITAVSVYLLAPAGLFAIFAAPPLIVVVAPAVAAFAVAAYVVHALARLHDKRRQKQNKD